MEPKGRALVVAAELEAAEAGDRVGVALDVGVLDLAAERAHALDCGLDILDLEEEVGRGAGVTAVQPPGHAGGPDREATLGGAGIEPPPEQSSVERASLLGLADAELEERQVPFHCCLLRWWFANRSRPADRGSGRRHILASMVEPEVKTGADGRGSVDLRLLRYMRTHGHSPGMEGVAKALGKAANNGAVWVALGLALALVDPDRRESWLICAALGPIAIVLNYGIKLAVKRPRPVLEGLPPLGGAPSSLSFPSAHALSSFAVATAMFRVDPATAGALVVALAISLGRPYLGMHYPSDVLAGALLGVILGLIVPLSL